MLKLLLNDYQTGLITIPAAAKATAAQAVPQSAFRGCCRPLLDAHSNLPPT